MRPFFGFPRFPQTKKITYRFLKCFPTSHKIEIPIQKIRLFRPGLPGGRLWQRERDGGGGPRETGGGRVRVDEGRARRQPRQVKGVGHRPGESERECI